MVRLILACCATPVILDAITATISKATGLPYVTFLVPDLIVYAALGFFVCRFVGMSGRFIAILAAAAASDATAGWWVSAIIGPGAPVHLTPASFLFTLVGVVFTSLVCGSIGGGISKMLVRRTR